MTDWRPIPDWPYEASSDGEVRRVGKAAPLRPSTHPTAGYKRVNLSKENRQTTFGVHRLVAAAFFGPPLAGQEVRHLSGDPSDNRPQNLCYGTRSENNLDQVRHGTHHHAQKTRCPRGHRLEVPNLIPSRLAKGQRICWSCAKARYQKAKHPHIDVQIVSDQKYGMLRRLADRTS